MGLHFGELSNRVRGTMSYTLSPFEQKAMKGIISKGVPNMIRRFRSQVFRVAPPIVLGYLLYDWGEKENVRIFRKNPKDFENES